MNSEQGCRGDGSPERQWFRPICAFGGTPPGMMGSVKEVLDFRRVAAAAVWSRGGRGWAVRGFGRGWVGEFTTHDSRVLVLCQVIY